MFGVSDVTLQERLEAAVEDLNACETADGIAEILRAEKITGKLGAACDCPLANRLYKQLGDGIDVEVDRNDYLAYGPYESAKVAVGSAARDFIKRFDRHAYADLVEPGSTCEWEVCERCNPPTAVTPAAYPLTPEEESAMYAEFFPERDDQGNPINEQ